VSQTAPPQAPEVSAQPDQNSHNQAIQNTAPPQAVPQQSASPQPAPQSHTPQQQAAQQEERDFERRALPLESNSAILGNNWRDAVIAKAVGAESEAAPVDISAPVEEPETSAGTGKHILLAEDNAINAVVAQALLEQLECTVTHVDNGLKAAVKVEEEAFDVIFMDIHMPVMDGYSAIEMIRNNGNETPIVVMSASAIELDKGRSEQLGCDGYLVKPVDVKDILSLAELLINKK